MAYFIKSAVICVGLLLLLLPAHSSGNPLPPRDPRSADSIDRCRQWQLDTNSEIESITQLSNGITVFNEITQPAPAHQSLLNYKLVCNAYILQNTFQGLQLLYRECIPLFYRYVSNRMS